MISVVDAYHVVAACVPLYVAMLLAYISVKWWKLFTPDQCAGINKFVAKFSIPLLSFQVISKNNPYKMNLKLIYADFLQKLLAFLVLVALTKISSRSGLRWIITGLSLSSLPNSLILGIPLLRAMYSEEAALLLAQIVVLQSLIWYNLLLFLFELNAAKSASVTPNPETPAIIDQSVRILSNGGLGMAMFSLGLFMASRPSIIACGTRMAAVAMALKFIVGPALMAASSFAIGLRGTLFKIAFVQAALPQGIVPFVFAKEYNVHPDILSTGVLFGMIITLPVTLAYYFLLAL
ncbi:auxin efflux carrier component 8 [Citrus sinensis]|uniref:Auxin efflux carrier component 8 n=1 Tax=Citrus sinensis TaxID=2711 RepID=A0ACB8K6C4_CITSI|nr:auxin efflux carrier component 8 [Citrus sinensis]